MITFSMFVGSTSVSEERVTDIELSSEPSNPYVAKTGVNTILTISTIVISKTYLTLKFALLQNYLCIVKYCIDDLIYFFDLL